MVCVLLDSIEQRFPTFFNDGPYSQYYTFCGPPPIDRNIPGWEPLEYILTESIGSRAREPL